jgi:hypothetical protein
LIAKNDPITAGIQISALGEALAVELLLFTVTFGVDVEADN